MTNLFFSHGSGSAVMIIFLYAVAFLCASSDAYTFAPSSSGKTRSVRLPLQGPFSKETAKQLRVAFGTIMETSHFLHQENSSDGTPQQTCTVPAFGHGARILFGPESTTTAGGEVEAYVFTAEGINGRQDFGWLCSQLYERKDSFQHLLNFETHLRPCVAQFHNAQPPHPGHPAAPVCQRDVKTLFQLHDEQLGTSWVQTLAEQGYVVLENGPKTTPNQHEKLSKYLKQTTDQAAHVRTDMVHFLTAEEAAAAGLRHHFDLLLGIANHLNEFRGEIMNDSDYQPIPPATKERPLTNPTQIQLAEYGLDDFYIAHSDNSWSSKDHRVRIRRNFRRWTCILYCNEGWRTDMGGALRLYKDSCSQTTPKQAVEECDYVDIYPQNGRMIVFDSRMVHAVRKNRSSTPRRALTVWINRPDKSGVRGEKYY